MADAAVNNICYGERQRQVFGASSGITHLYYNHIQLHGG